MKMRSFQVCQCGAPLQMNEAEAPQPQGTQVLLKMLAAGVCHSDLHIWDGFFVTFLFPFMDEFPNYQHFDEALSPAHKRRINWRKHEGRSLALAAAGF